MTVKRETLPSGCEPRFHECVEACALWNEVNRQYDMAKQTFDYVAYDQARKEYNNHFKQQRELKEFWDGSTSGQLKKKHESSQILLKGRACR